MLGCSSWHFYSSMYRKKKRKRSSVLKNLDWVLGCSSWHFYSSMYRKKKRKRSWVLKNLDWVLGCSSWHFYSSMYRKKRSSVLKNLDWVLGCSSWHFYSSMYRKKKRKVLQNRDWVLGAVHVGVQFMLGCSSWHFSENVFCQEWPRTVDYLILRFIIVRFTFQIAFFQIFSRLTPGLSYTARNFAEKLPNDSRPKPHLVKMTYRQNDTLPKNVFGCDSLPKNILLNNCFFLVLYIPSACVWNVFPLILLIVCEFYFMNVWFHAAFRQNLYVLTCILQMCWLIF